MSTSHWTPPPTPTPPTPSTSWAPPPPPSSPPSSAAPTKKLLIFAGVGLGALAIVSVLFLIFVSLGGTSGSTQNDEVKSAQKTDADFLTWRDKKQKFVAKGAVNIDEAIAGKKYGWWDKQFVLPNESAAKAAVKRRLRPDIQLISLTPVSHEVTGQEMSVTYQLEVRPKSSLYTVPIRPMEINDPSLGEYRKLTQYLMPSDDLPPGYAYLPEAKRLIAEGGKIQRLEWVVRTAVKEENTWKILDAEPILLQSDPELEGRLLKIHGASEPDLIRADWQIANMDIRRQTEFDRFNNRILQIKDQVANMAEKRKLELPEIQPESDIKELVSSYRKDRSAALPSKAKMDSSKFGGSGSGEPTKTAVRIGGTAGTGAAIGALAGGGEAAGIGALAGVLGGLLYDAVSKGNDKKKFEAQKKADYNRQASAHSYAVKAMESDVRSYESKLRAEHQKQKAHRESLLRLIEKECKELETKLIAEYEKELKDAAQQRRQALGYTTL